MKEAQFHYFLWKILRPQVHGALIRHYAHQGIPAATLVVACPGVGVRGKPPLGLLVKSLSRIDGNTNQFDLFPSQGRSYDNYGISINSCECIPYKYGTRNAVDGKDL